MEQGAVPRRLQDQQQHHPGYVRLLLAAAAAVYDPAKAKKAAGRGGISRTVSIPDRSGATPPMPISARSRSIRCSRSASARKLRPVERAGFARPTPARNTTRGYSARRQRRVRQRRDAAGLVRRQGRLQRVRQLSRHRRAVSAAGERTRPQEARGDPPQDAAARVREGDRRADWELAFINGVGPRLGESSFGRIGGFPYTAPFEDLTIKKG